MNDQYEQMTAFLLLFIILSIFTTITCYSYTLFKLLLTVTVVTNYDVNMSKIIDFQKEKDKRELEKLYSTDSPILSFPNSTDSGYIILSNSDKFQSILDDIIDDLNRPQRHIKDLVFMYLYHIDSYTYLPVPKWYVDNYFFKAIKPFGKIKAWYVWLLLKFLGSKAWNYRKHTKLLQYIESLY